MQSAHEGKFFTLMALHAGQNVIQGAHGLANIRSFVEHHALRPSTHGRIGEFGT